MTLSKGQGHRSRSNGLGSAERFLLSDLCLVFVVKVANLIQLRKYTFNHLNEVVIVHAGYLFVSDTL